MPERKIKSFPRFVFLIAVSAFAGLMGSVFTMPAIDSWYKYLTKSPLTPPDFLFAVVWTFLYLAMGTAAYLVWQKGFKEKQVKDALKYYFIQLGLNISWSFIFFGAKNIELALFEIVLLWFAIFATIVKFWKFSKTAAFLLIPYILWVTFAAYLNFMILILN